MVRWAGWVCRDVCGEVGETRVETRPSAHVGRRPGPGPPARSLSSAAVSGQGWGQRDPLSFAVCAERDAVGRCQGLRAN